MKTGTETKYDLLVSNAIQFLASVADRPHYKNLFEDSAVLGSICEKVFIIVSTICTIYVVLFSSVENLGLS